MDTLYFVNGATGHIGNNLVRALVSQGKKVRASVRNRDCIGSLREIGCEIVCSDFSDLQSLRKALQGVDILFCVAAAREHWALNPEKDIVRPNIIGTENMLKIAKEKNVKRIIYVSSIVALDRRQAIIKDTSWNTAFSNAYFKSKTLAEKRAWEMTREFNLPLITVLPSSVLGAHISKNLTPAMEFLYKILSARVPFDPDFGFCYVDVQDVVKALIAAAHYGKIGSRYIIANSCSTNSNELFKLSREVDPTLQIPKKISKFSFWILAALTEVVSFFTHKRPELMRNMLKVYWRKKLSFDISRAQKDLDFSPKPPRQVIKAAMYYLKQDWL